jgi:hypothetical protein
MQILNGILTTIKSNKEFPLATSQIVPFYVKINNEFELVNLTIKTAGGDSRHLLASCFEEFFTRTGILTGKFAWGKDYFPDKKDGEVDEEERNSSAV